MSQSKSDSGDGMDGSEKVWLAANRGSTKARKFHTNPECHQLSKVENVEERRRDQVGHRILCTSCKGRRDPPGMADNPCPYCNRTVQSVAKHLREGCPDAPGSSGKANRGVGD